MKKFIVSLVFMLFVGCVTDDQQQGFGDFSDQEQVASQDESDTNRQEDISDESQDVEGNADIQSVNESAELDQQDDSIQSSEDSVSEVGSFENVDQNSVLYDDPTASLNSDTEDFLAQENPIQEVSVNSIDQDSNESSADNSVQLPAPLTLPDLEGEDIQEVSESLSRLWWIGQWYNKEKKSVSIEMTTRGAPSYQVLQEMNQQNQPELVVRFLKTSLRPRMRRDLDANEFHSPVSYVRMRQNTDSNWTDVVLTFRDEVKTSLYAKNGNIVISVPLSEKYAGAAASDQVPAEQAVRLENANVIPSIESGSDTPLNGTSVSSIDKKINGAEKSQINITRLNHKKSDANIVDDEQAVDDSNIGVKLDSKDLDSLGDDFGLLMNQPNIQVLSKFIINGVAQSNIDEDLEQFSNTAADPFIEDEPVEHVSDSFENEISPVSNNVPEIDPIEESSSDASASDLLGDVESDGEGFSTQAIGTNVNALTEVDLNQLVTLDFRDAPFGEVLRALSRDSKISFTLVPEVSTKKIYLSLDNVPWHRALKALLESNDLGMVKISDRLIRVDTVDNISAEREKLQRVKQSAERLIDTKILVIRLNYAKVGEISGLISSMLQNSSSSNSSNSSNNRGANSADGRIKIQSDARTNSLIIEAIPSQLAKVKVLIERLDKQTPQVEVVSRLVEMSRSANEGYGISWGLPFSWDGTNGLGFGGLTFPNYVRSTFAVDPGLTANQSFRTGLKIGSISSGIDIDAILNFTETSSKTKIIQTNRIVAQDNQAANVSGGTSDFFVVNGSDGQEGSVQSVNYNITLGVTPQVTAEGSISMNINLSSSTPSGGSSTAAAGGTSNRELSTTLLIDNGETAVIGGLWNSSKTSAERSVPFLSKIPFLGALFKNQSNNSSQSDMLMMITPKIINGSKLYGADSSESEYEVASLNESVSDIDAEMVDDQETSQQGVESLQEASQQEQLQENPGYQQQEQQSEYQQQEQQSEYQQQEQQSEYQQQEQQQLDDI